MSIPFEESKALKEAKKLLKSLKAQYPWRFDQLPTDPARFPSDLVMGAVRTKDGRNVIQPHPESASMVVSFPETMDIIVKGPELLAALVQEIEDEKARWTNDHSDLETEEQEPPKRRIAPRTAPKDE